MSENNDNTKKIKDMLLFEEKKFLITFTNVFQPYHMRMQLAAKSKEEALKKFNKDFPSVRVISVQEIE